MVDNKGGSKRKLKCKRHKRGKFSPGKRACSKEAREAWQCVDMVSVDPNALEIGTVLFFERSRVAGGLESCARVTVFAAK